VGGQDVDGLVAVVQQHCLDHSLFVLLAKPFNDQRFVPHKDHAVTCRCYCSFLVGNEDCLGKLDLRSLFVDLLDGDSGGVILELLDTSLPVEIDHSFGAVSSQFSWIIWIELYPVLREEVLGVFELKRNDRALLFLIGPVPKSNCLGLVVSKCH